MNFALQRAPLSSRIITVGDDESMAREARATSSFHKVNHAAKGHQSSNRPQTHNVCQRGAEVWVTWQGGVVLMVRWKRLVLGEVEL